MRPHTSYIICATSRSGSTLLCDHLTATGHAGRPEEYFNRRPRATLGQPVWARWDRRDPAVYIARILELGTSPNGIFGVKLTTSALTALLAHLKEGVSGPQTSDGDVLARSFPDLHFLWITRRNKVRQAISAYRALRSDHWIEPAGTAPRAAEQPYSFALIDDQVNAILGDEAVWSHFFVANDIRPHTVIYEDLVADPEETMRTIMRYLRINYDLETLPAASVRQQSDERTDLWEQRYYRDKARQRRYRLVRLLPLLVLRGTLRRAYLQPVLKRRAPTIVSRLFHL